MTKADPSSVVQKRLREALMGLRDKEAAERGPKGAQRRAAETAGLSEARMSRILRGEPVSPATIASVSSKLQIPVDVLRQDPHATLTAEEVRECKREVRERLFRMLERADTRTQLRVKRLHPDARLPTYATPGSAGLDLYACRERTCMPGGLERLSLGIAVEIPPGFEGQIRPRSGLASRGVVAVLGTIDSDFRGELQVLLTSQTGYYIAKGDRIAQLVIAPVARAHVVEVEELSETVRGGGAFGSTGT